MQEIQEVREVQIGLLGLGTVGSGVLEIIRRHEAEWVARYNLRPVIKRILIQNPAKPRLVEVAAEVLTTDYREILNDPAIEVIVEVMGGEEPALTVAKAALSSGKYLVTANKKMLALHGPTLYKLALHHGVELAFEASVGSGIPIIQPLRESLNSNEIQEMLGIINGTTNYILTNMEQNGKDYTAVLQQAMELGYAEADPTSDVEGHDACYKLSVLTAVAFGTQVPVTAIRTCGISTLNLADMQMAAELGYRIKLVAKAQKTARGIKARVHPTLLPFAHPLAGINGVNNALWVKGDAVGEVMFTGPGAGMMATGSAVVSDLLRVCRRVVRDKQTAAKELPHLLDLAYREVAATGTAMSEVAVPEARGIADLPNSLTEPTDLSGAPSYLPGVDSWAPRFGGADTPLSIANAHDVSSQLTDTESAHFFISLQTRGQIDSASLVKECQRAGIPVGSLEPGLNYIGIMTGLCEEEAVQRFVESLLTNEGCCRSCYYYVEGRGI